MNTQNERERIGSRIRELRMKKGLSQVELAENAKITQSHIVRIESGRYNVGVDVLSRVLGALGRKLSDIKS